MMFWLFFVMIEVICGSKEFFSGFLEEIWDVIGCILVWLVNYM